MTTQTCQQIILSGIENLPAPYLEEIADFVYFMRKRALSPKAFEDEISKVLIKSDLQHANDSELNHLESEFENYAQCFPKE